MTIAVSIASLFLQRFPLDPANTRLCRICIANFCVRYLHMIRLCDGNSMKSKIEYFALPLAVLLVSSQFALAQGPSGGNGAVASIPAVW